MCVWIVIVCGLRFIRDNFCPLNQGNSFTSIENFKPLPQAPVPLYIMSLPPVTPLSPSTPVPLYIMSLHPHPTLICQLYGLCGIEPYRPRLWVNTLVTIPPSLPSLLCFCIFLPSTPVTLPPQFYYVTYMAYILSLPLSISISFIYCVTHCHSPFHLYIVLYH